MAHVPQPEWRQILLNIPTMYLHARGGVYVHVRVPVRAFVCGDHGSNLYLNGHRTKVMTMYLALAGTVCGNSS